MPGNAFGAALVWRRYFAFADPVLKPYCDLVARTSLTMLTKQLLLIFAP